jgi:hypothetical protein
LKKADWILLLIVVLVLASFFVFPTLYHGYRKINADFPYLMSFVKFAILATLGECLGLRIRTGKYYQPGFGLLPRALVWGFLGITIKMAFVIFGEGAPIMLATMGVKFSSIPPDEILASQGFSALKLLSAFATSVTLNLFFAPVFMTFHRITDMHIIETGGSLKGFFRPIRFADQFRQMDWDSMWHFVFKKTIPLFWIPAQTINFLLPGEWRILVAAVYSIILGVFLSLASKMQESRL